MITEKQFGFRDGRGTGMACSMLNDVISYCNEAKSSLYIAALDAEECFDSVCHFSLFVKLIGVLPDIHWLLLYNWYRQLNVVVKWRGCFSGAFTVSK